MPLIKGKSYEGKLEEKKPSCTKSQKQQVKMPVEQKLGCCWKNQRKCKLNACKTKERRKNYNKSTAIPAIGSYWQLKLKLWVKVFLNAFSCSLSLPKAFARPSFGSIKLRYIDQSSIHMSKIKRINLTKTHL